MLPKQRIIFAAIVWEKMKRISDPKLNLTKSLTDGIPLLMEFFCWRACYRKQNQTFKVFLVGKSSRNRISGLKGCCDCKKVIKRYWWQRRDSNEHNFWLVPKTGALDHSVTLPRWPLIFLEVSIFRRVFCSRQKGHGCSYAGYNSVCTHFNDYKWSTLVRMAVYFSFSHTLAKQG